MAALIFAALGTVATAIAALVADWLKSDAKLISVSGAVDEATKASAALKGWCDTYKEVQTLPDGEAKRLANDYAILVLQTATERIQHGRSAATASLAGEAILDTTHRVISRTQKVLRFWRITRPM